MSRMVGIAHILLSSITFGGTKEIMSVKLLDFYTSLDVKSKKTDLTIVPFQFDTVVDEEGIVKAKGLDGQLYDTHSEASFYSVIGANDKKYRVFAFIGKPATPAPKSGYPAVVLAHGGAGISYFEWVEHWVSRGYVAIAPDLGGHYAKSGLARNELNTKGVPNGKLEDMGSFCETEDLSNSWMYFATVALGSAINALYEYAEIDSEKIALVGISWGGVLALHAVGVEKRFKAASIVYSSAYLSSSKWTQETYNLKSLKKDELAVYREYLDPSNSIRLITQPILFTAGMDDVAFTWLNRCATTQRIESDKTFAYRAQFAHGHWEGWTPKEAYAFTDTVFGLRKMLPTISLKEMGGELQILMQNEEEIEKVYIGFTIEKPDREVNQLFEEYPIEPKEGKYTFVLPKETTACFARYVLKDGTTFSTDIKIL